MPLTGNLKGAERKRIRKNKVKKVLEIVLPGILFYCVIYCANESYKEYLQIREIRSWPSYIISNEEHMPEDEAEANSMISSMEQEINLINGVEKVFAEKYELGAVVFEGMEDSEIIRNLDRNSIYEETGQAGIKVRDGKKSIEIFSVSDNSVDYYLGMTEGNTADREAFLKGEEVIVVLPDYIVGEDYSILRPGQDYSAIYQEEEYEDYMEQAVRSVTLAGTQDIRRENILKPGDTIDVYSYKGYEEQADGTYAEVYSDSAKITKVGGIIRETDNNRYAFSKRLDNWYDIIVSRTFMERYIETSNHQTLNTVHFKIYAGWTADYMGTDKVVAAIARENDFYQLNDHQINVDRYQLLQVSILMRCFVCLIIILFDIIVLYQLSIASIRRQQASIGILQAVGMSGKQLMNRKIKSSILKATFSLLAAVSIYIAQTAADQKNFIYLLAELKLIYNNNTWFIHVALAGIVFLITVGCAVMPVKKMIRRPAVENIRLMSD